jgi:ParB/RepB/Spo0J family partition protein
VAKSSRNAAAANLQRLLNSNTFKANVPTEQDIMPAASSDGEQPISRQASIERETLRDDKRIQYIAIELLLDNPYQPRREILIDDDLREMAEGIKTYDLLGAYPARRHPEMEGYFQIGFGHRRREASRLAGKATMPIVLEDLDNPAMAGLAAVENIHRKDLTDLELGRLFLGMQSEGYTQEEIADSIKKKRGYVVNRLRLAEAPADIQAFIERKPDSLRVVAYLIKVTNEEDRALLIDRLTHGKLTADDLAGDISELIIMLKSNVFFSDQANNNAQPFGRSVSSNLSLQAELSSAEASQGTNGLSSSTSRNPEGNEGIIAGADDSVRQSVNDAEIEAIRIGSAKLRSIQRSYEAYYEGIKRRKNISRREQEFINRISEIHELIMAKIAEES